MTKPNLIAASTSLIAIGLLICILSVNSPRNSLDRFLQEVATVDLGKTRLDDWRKHVEQLHLSNLTITCIPATCEFTWSGKNTVLRMLHLAPQTIAVSSVRFKDGVADQIYLALVMQRRNEKKEWYDEKGWSYAKPRILLHHATNNTIFQLNSDSAQASVSGL